MAPLVLCDARSLFFKLKDRWDERGRVTCAEEKSERSTLVAQYFVALLSGHST